MFFSHLYYNQHFPWHNSKTCIRYINSAGGFLSVHSIYVIYLHLTDSFI